MFKRYFFIYRYEGSIKLRLYRTIKEYKAFVKGEGFQIEPIKFGGIWELDLMDLTRLVNEGTFYPKKEAQ